MPLKALIDSEPIQSFDLAKEEWAALKVEYKQRELTMPCCGRTAIPKTSNLGTQYFAHSRKSDCTSAPETAEHLYLKFVVAKEAKELGWHVSTEKAGHTPSGEGWIADILCEKGNTKVAIEIQWSPQSEDEYIRRTLKYKESGVRCLWLFRQQSNRTYFQHEFERSKGLPKFGFKRSGNDFLVSEFSVSVRCFVVGALSGSLQWAPKEGDLVEASIRYEAVNCWRCKKVTQIVFALDLNTETGDHIDTLGFDDSQAAEFIAEKFESNLLIKHGIGPIKPRYSKTIGGHYVSNGCIHCDALQGNFFLHEADWWNDNLSRLKKVFNWSISFGLSEPSWRFKGTKGRHSY